jgi:hypothetical protein
VPANLPSTGAALGHDEENANRTRQPTPLRGNQSGHKSGLPIDRGKHVLEVIQVGLDFDEQQSSHVWSPRQHIDRALLPEVLERVLEHGLPTQYGESGHDFVDQGGVTGIEEPRQRHSPPPGREGRRDLQRRADLADRAEGEPLELSPLDRRHRSLADARQRRNVPLTQATPTPNGPNHLPELYVFHARRLRSDP